MNRLSRIFLSALVIASLIGLSAPDAQAGDDARRGTAGASHLLIPLTARSASLGASLTSGLTGMNGLEAIYANPAGLALNTGTAAIFSRMEYVADIGVNYFGVSQAFGNNNIAFMVSAWDFGDIAKQTEANPEKSSVTYSADFIVAGLTYARQFTDRISAGTTVKVINESIEDVGATAIAFDAGMTYVVGESGLRLGVALKNVGSELQYDGVGLTRSVTLPEQKPNATTNSLVIESDAVALPSLLNFGVSYERAVGQGAVVTVLGNFRSNSFDQDEYSGGLEVALFDVLYLRGGMQMVADSDLTFFSGGNFGAGINLDLAGTQLQVDYALRTVEFFDNVNMFTVGVTL